MDSKKPGSHRRHHPALVFVCAVIIPYLAISTCCSSSGGGGGGSVATRGPTERTRRGWLCDYDLRREVAVWSKPAQPFKDGNEIAFTVPVPLADCVVATSTMEQIGEDGIYYYHLDAGNGNRGWVDLDYFYYERSDFNP